MKYLIDTHIFIWFATGNKKLASNYISLIKNPEIEIFLSNVSVWEIALKSNLGKLSIGIPFHNMEHYLSEQRIQILPYTFGDLNRLFELPFHHRDPFDRLIIAQAMNNNLTVISDDKNFSNYQIPVI